jgi:hypothetical protein
MVTEKVTAAVQEEVGKLKLPARDVSIAPFDPARNKLELEAASCVDDPTRLMFCIKAGTVVPALKYTLENRAGLLGKTATFFASIQTASGFQGPAVPITPPMPLDSNGVILAEDILNAMPVLAEQLREGIGASAFKDGKAPAQLVFFLGVDCDLHCGAATQLVAPLEIEVTMTDKCAPPVAPAAAAADCPTGDCGASPGSTAPADAPSAASPAAGELPPREESVEAAPATSAAPGPLPPGAASSEPVLEGPKR